MWSPRWIWISIAVLTCLFVVPYAFPLTDMKCATGQRKIFNTINKNYTCRSCPTCPSEHGVSVKCDTVVTQETVLQCVKCVSGVNYSSDSNKEQCQPCQSTTCLENEIVNGSCSPEEDSTACSGICEKGYSINSGKTRCVHLNIVVAGDNITLNLTDGPVHTTPSTKTQKLSGLLIALIVFGGCFSTFGVAFCYYRQSHSRNQASENVELRDMDSGARTTSTGNKREENVTLLSVELSEDNGPLQSPSLGEAFPSLGNIPQETASTNSEGSATTTAEIENEALLSLSSTPQETASTNSERIATTTDEIEIDVSLRLLDSTPQETPPTDSELIETPTAENETSEAVPTNNNACDTPCFQVEQPKRTTRGVNLPAASPSLSTPNHTPLLSVRRSPRRPTMIGDLNQNVYAEVCKKLNRDIEGKDWRQIAGKMDYSVDKVKQFSMKNDPTDALLQDWGTNEGNDVVKLIEICKMVERGDVVETLEEALGIRRQSGVEEEGR